ncbi:MAG: tetratricopeptide repeat protein [Gemmatales bacterium]|nr:tetratricopeptide repeat protein [Gemmatales bacterium]MDW8386517.1 tetratricopeptide repeat protein [Gemmatales bacterium]
MTATRTRESKRTRKSIRLTARRLWPTALAVLLGVTTGCQSFSAGDLWKAETWTYENLTRPNVKLPDPPQQAVYRAGHWEQEGPLQPGTLAGDLASAKVLFERGDHGDAEKVFRWLAARAKKEKNPDIYEEALFYQAECQFAQRRYPAARETYETLLKEFPSSRFRGEAVQRQFAIAEYWLEDTRAEIREKEKNKDGWSFSLPRLVSFEKEKPTFDTEGHAQKVCEAIYIEDPAGPLAPQALYRAGGISFFRERYEEADTYYSMLVDQYPKSPLAPAALELAIQSKVNQVRGPAYDSRKLIEARQLVDTAMRSYPELEPKREQLERTLIAINEQQAEKDYSIAEFYRRTNHPGAAYFYYEIVRRRYPGTTWAAKATERMHELRSKVEAEAAAASENKETGTTR